MHYWLMKSEPDVYSIDDLARDGKTLWTAIRNYQARNYMAQSMKLGDLALFYHSNAEPSGVAGLMRVSAAAAADPTQFDPKDDHYEPRATRDKPVWSCVEVAFVARATTFVSLATLRASKPLAKMALFQAGSRLSITPVRAGEYKLIAKIAGFPPVVPAIPPHPP
jgi:predicted RNA-binding protein with PUA-like domain